MSAVNIIFGTYPTQTPGALGSGIAPFISSPKGEALLSLTSDVSGAIDVWLLRWDGSDAWWPVSALRQPDLVLAGGQPAAFPLESSRRPQPPLNGQNRFVFQTEGPAYYCLYAPTAKSTDVSDAAINELFPLSAPYSVGAAVRGVLPRYVNPVAANSTGIHAAVAANAASAFPGPFGSIETWGRTLRYVFAAMWDGGDIVVTGLDQFGRPQSETITSAAGSTVDGLKVFREVTAISHTVVGATANTVSVGIGPALGVPFSFQQGQEFVDGVAELATALDTINYSFKPATACNGAHDYDFLGW